MKEINTGCCAGEEATIELHHYMYEAYYSYGYEIGIEASPDGTTWYTVGSWYDPYYLYGSTGELTIPFDLGDELHIRLYFDGTYSYQPNVIWYIYDMTVRVDGEVINYESFYTDPYFAAPRVGFEFDAEDGTGIYINGEGGNGPIPNGDEPPTAEANGDYFAEGPNDPILFTCVGSHDNDQLGDYIVKYRWDFENDGIWDTGWMSFSTPTYSYTYGYEFHGYAKVQVEDNEGDRANDTARVDIECAQCFETVITMDVVNIPECQTSWGYLMVQDVTDLGSCEVKISYDPNVVRVIDVGESDIDMSFFVDQNAHTINILSYTTGSVSGDVKIAKITFEKATGADVGDWCDLAIIETSLRSDTNTPILHNIQSGKAFILSCDGVQGDMNGDASLNGGDVRHLAKYLLGDPAYSTVFAEPNVNGDTFTNSADVRYLALYILGDPMYYPLYPTI
jgi:hypothetical protein